MPRTPWIVDCDSGSDDWIALLLLACAPEVDLRLVTVTGCGLARLPAGADNVRRVLCLAGRDREVPVALGSPIPLQGDGAFPVAWRDQTDRLLGLQLAEGRRPPLSAPAAQALHDLLSGSAAPVSLLALGPLTEVALALRRWPHLAGRIARIVVMGGALEVAGNAVVEGHPCQGAGEWNLFVDPLAARIVFGSGVPITLVPLDATDRAPVRPAFVARLAQQPRGPVGDFLLALYRRLQPQIAAGRTFHWDPLAAAVALQPDLCRQAEQRLTVLCEADGERPLKPGFPAITPFGEVRRPLRAGTAGRLLRSANGPAVFVCLQPDLVRLENLLLSIA